MLLVFWVELYRVYVQLRNMRINAVLLVFWVELYRVYVQLRNIRINVVLLVNGLLCMHQISCALMESECSLIVQLICSWE